MNFEITLPYIRETLKKYNPSILGYGVPAAVLVPLFERHGSIHILFTARGYDVEHHKGQISFPGGVAENSDKSFYDTAIRESREEIGLMPEDVEILGSLDETFVAVSKFTIHPVVGIIPEKYKFIIQSKEVDRIITIPINVFFPESNNKKEYYEYENGCIWYGPTYLFENNVIWGATARITDSFIKLIFSNINSRPDAQYL